MWGMEASLFTFTVMGMLGGVAIVMTEEDGSVKTKSNPKTPPDIVLRAILEAQQEKQENRSFLLKVVVGTLQGIRKWWTHSSK